MDTLAIATAGSQVAGIVKNLIDITKSAGKTEIVGKLIDLQSAFMDLQHKQQELIDENNKLKNKNLELLEKLKIKDNVKFHYGAYWKILDDSSFDGPFSKKVWEDEKKLSMMSLKNRGLLLHGHDCFQFKYNFFMDSDIESETVAVPLSFINDNKVTGLEEWLLIFPK